MNPIKSNIDNGQDHSGLADNSNRTILNGEAGPKTITPNKLNNIYNNHQPTHMHNTKLKNSEKSHAVQKSRQKKQYWGNQCSLHRASNSHQSFMRLPPDKLRMLREPLRFNVIRWTIFCALRDEPYFGGTIIFDHLRMKKIRITDLLLA